MKDEDGKQDRNVSRRDFLVVSSSAVISGSIGAGVFPDKALASVTEDNRAVQAAVQTGPLSIGNVSGTPRPGAPARNPGN